MRLNPCCSGQWSRTMIRNILATSSPCLNPYCSGQWSRTFTIGETIHLTGEVS